MKYKIGEFKLVLLQTQIDELNKRAEKLGMLPMSVNVLSEEFVTTIRRQNWSFDSILDSILDEVVTVKLLNIEIIGEIPVLSGWQFIATIQHEEAGNIIHNISGADLPAAYRECAPNCDHCQSIRYRKDTYVVRNIETGEYKQVGKSCLKDFTRSSDVEQILRYIENLRDIISDCSDEDFFGGRSGHVTPYFEILHYLGLVNHQIENHGWMSRTQAREAWNKVATADRASKYLSCRWVRTVADKQNWEENQATESDINKAKAVLAYVRDEIGAKADKSEYEHNLFVACSKDHIESREFGLVASAIVSYNKHLEYLTKHEKEKQCVNEYIGKIGERLTLLVTVLRINYIDSEYGTTKIHHMMTEAGNRLTWFSTSATLPINEAIKIKGTIKAHEDYKGQLQTVLSRCKLI